MKLILQIEDREGNRQEIKSSSSHNNPECSTSCNVDKGSASASEILAAAFKESGNITLVGEKIIW